MTALNFFNTVILSAAKDLIKIEMLNTNIKWAFILLLASGAGWGSGFNSSSKGTVSGEFLKFGAGARAESLGGAYSALADDATALYWNPAALTNVKKHSVAFMHALHIDASFMDYAAYAHNTGKYGAIGGSLQYMSAGDITETDETGANTGSFEPNDLAISLGYAFKLKNLKALSIMNGFSVGVTGKFIQSTIVDTARSLAADAGILSPEINGRLRLAFTGSNLFGKMKFEQEAEELPVIFKMGSYYRLSGRWMTVLDIGFPKDNDPFVAMGTEYIVPVRSNLVFAGRMGFNSRTLRDINGFTGFSFGVGLALPKLAIDYGFLPFGFVGSTHRLSLTFRF